MKKYELNTLRDYLTELVVNTMSEEVIDVANEIWKLLDTFDVDPPSAREIKDHLGWTGPEHEPEEAFRPGVYVAKNSTSIFADPADMLDFKEEGKLLDKIMKELEKIKKENEIALVNAGYSKDLHGTTPIFTKSIALEADPDENKYVKVSNIDEVLKAMSKQADTNPPKRKWYKWSEIKDKFFSKKEQQKLIEATKEEKPRACCNCKKRDTCKPFDRTACFYHSLENWEENGDKECP